MGTGTGTGMGTGKSVSARPGRRALHPYFCHGRELFSSCSTPHTCTQQQDDYINPACQLLGKNAKKAKTPHENYLKFEIGAVQRIAKLVVLDKI